MTRNTHPLAVLFAMTMVFAVPAWAAAEDAAHGEEAEPAAHGDGHGGMSLHDIANGEHSMEFWGSVVNFSLLVLILVWKGKKPMGDFLAGRRSEVETRMAEAAAMKAKAEAAFKEYNEKLGTLDHELAKLRSDIARAAEEDKARILKEAKESAQRLVAETESLIVRQGEQWAQSLRREVVEAALVAAEQVLKQALTADDQSRLASEYTSQLAQPRTEKRV